MKLDTLKMLEDINKLVENDFCAEMEAKLMPHAKPYTQWNAQKMAIRLARVYTISHATHCKACQKPYLK